MADSRGNTVIVGMAVFVAFIIATWSLFYLQGYAARRNKLFYKAYYDHVGMLLAGDNITVAGVPVGRVQTIGLEGKKAVVEFTVDPKVSVNEGTVALIEASDLFGTSYVQLLIGDGPRLEAGSAVRGELAPGVRELVKEGVQVVERTIVVLDQARALFARMDTLLAPESSLSKSFSNVEAFTADTRQLSARFSRYGDMLEETMLSLDSAAVGFRSVVQDNSAGVKQMIARMDEVSTRLDSILIDLTAGRGMIGRLMQDETLYDELRDTALQARQLIREIREHPEKFIQIKAF